MRKLAIVTLLVALIVYYALSEIYTPLTTEAYVQAYVVQIAPQVGEKVVRVHVREGDRVKAGALLFELDTALFKQSVASLDAKLQTDASAAGGAQRRGGGRNLPGPGEIGLAILADEVQRVDLGAVLKHLEMEVGTGGMSGGAHQGDFLALAHHVALLHQELLVMAITRGETIAVVDLHHLAITRPLAGEGHESGCDQRTAQIRRKPRRIPHDLQHR